MSIVAPPTRTNRPQIVRASTIAELEAALAPDRRLVPPAWSTFVSALLTISDDGLDYRLLQPDVRIGSVPVFVPEIAGFAVVVSVDGDEVEIADVESRETPAALAVAARSAMETYTSIEKREDLAQAHQFILDPFIDFEVLREFALREIAWRRAAPRSHRDSGARRLIRRFVSGRRTPNQIETAVMLGDNAFKTAVSHAIASGADVDLNQYMSACFKSFGRYNDDGRSNSSVLVDHATMLFTGAAIWLKRDLFPRNRAAGG